MPVAPTGTRLWRDLDEAERDYLRSAPGGSLAQRCRKVGAKFKNVSNALRRERKRGRIAERGPPEAPPFPPPDPKPTELGTTIRVEDDERGKVVTATAVVPGPSRILTLEDLLKATEVDLARWRVERWRANSWEQHSVKRGLVTLRQVRANLVPNQDYPAQLALERLLERIAEHAPVYDPPPPLYESGEFLLVPCLFDAHFGKRTLSGLTLEQTAEGFIDAVRRLLGRIQAGGWTVGRILYPVGNDLIDADTYHETTTAGTQMSLVQDLADVEDVVCAVQTQAIELLASVAPVDVVAVPGNHDFHVMTWLGRFLWAWFQRHPRVRVDRDKASRKYYRWEDVLLGLTHGKEEKTSELPLIMATEAAGDWAQSSHREWLIGHKHTQATLVQELHENRGVLVRLVPPLADAGAWDFLHAFTSNTRAAQGLLYHKGGATDVVTVVA
ncbi:MAG: hypothetical protein JXA37_03600 [Chloroflexia bacterium]|nr:hypothetical protein [Chloroflexia bacterium]